MQVIACFIIQLVLAAVFWGYQFTNHIVLPLACRRRGGYDPRAHEFWLIQDYHEACVWNQLIFSFALCLAGLVRQTQKQQAYIGVYESASIVTSISVTAPATVLSTISFLPVHDAEEPAPLFDQRRCVFIGAYIGTVITGLMAVLSPFFAGRVNNLLWICEEYGKREISNWSNGSMAPVNDGKAMFLGFTVATVVAIIMGLVSWRFMKQDGDTQPIVLIVWTMASVLLWYIGCNFFRDLLAMRGQMSSL